MLADNRLERPVGCDDPIGRPRADEDGAPQWQVAGALEPGPARARGAELLEALWVEHERRPARRTPPGVPKDARAEPMDDVDLAVAHELPRKPSRAQSEERIRGAPVDHRRATPAGAGKRPVGDRPQRDRRMDRIRVVMRLRRARDERGLDAGVGEVAHEIVDVALEPAQAVQREHRSGDDGDAERGFHLGGADRDLTNGSWISRISLRAADSAELTEFSRDAHPVCPISEIRVPVCEIREGREIRVP